MKHAFLIIAHSNFNQLKRLIELMDFKNFDFFIHIDKKSHFDGLNLKLKYSKIYFVERLNVYWGDSSQIKVELLLLSKALLKDYDYYHLLSGMDIPVKTPTNIYEFFEKHNGKEFVHFASNTRIQEYHIEDRVRYKYRFLKYYKSPCLIIKIINRGLFKLNILFQHKKKIDFELKYGSSWFSITREFAKYLVENKKNILKIFGHSFCGDELFVQTLLYNSSFNKNIYSLEDNFSSCLRYIDMDNGNPYIPRTFTYIDKEDFYLALNGDYIFMRKVDELKDKKFVDYIIKHIK